MTPHEQIAEDLALYALGSLEGNERQAVEEHMETCAACQRELQALRGDMALLALSASGPAPPLRSRERLMKAIAQEPNATKAGTATRPLFGWMLWPATAAVLLLLGVSGLLWRDNLRLVRQYASLHGEFTQQQSEVQHARELLAMFTAPDAMHVTLVASKTKPQPQGKAMYLRDRGALLFMASNMTPLPPNKVYELWLLPMSGAPIPAGTFKPNGSGSAMVMDPPLPKGVEAKAFAITVESEGGSTTPTMPIVMMGASG